MFEMTITMSKELAEKWRNQKIETAGQMVSEVFHSNTFEGCIDIKNEIIEFSKHHIDQNSYHLGKYRIVKIVQFATYYGI